MQKRHFIKVKKWKIEAFSLLFPIQKCILMNGFPVWVNMFKTEDPLSSTSIPGISNAAKNAHNKPRKMAWIALTIVGVGLTLFQVETVLEDYLNYPVRTKTSMTNTGKQEFPAVTVCPLVKV